MSTTAQLSFLLLAPLVGFLINGLGRNKNSSLVAGAVGTLAAAISFIFSILLFLQLTQMPAEARQINVQLFNWINVANLSVDMGFLVDPVSGVMILIITGVGTLIHLFSMGYMSHDPGVAKYFSYLNLFLFNMLLLVLGDNLLVLFVGWEGVGLCSYLLIGFWFNDSQKAAAGMKAFVTNRIGDAAFLIGMFILFASFGTLSFSELIAALPTTPEETVWGPITLATLFLFIGATGKSAQIPLYVWLPDAMAGPTPVSALIHAATMVTAGVYMIVRLNAMFLLAPTTMMIIAIVGVATVVMAAIIGIAQTDIKKVLAYSTVSQLGYMFLACGVGAFGAAMFHLMTHAFFKALMFLGSGSVIHGMHEEQDITKMGGLKKYMPITHITFVIGWLAIIGTPLFSGFFSKDEILWLSFHSPRGHVLLWVLGVVGATLTAFYMTRLMALTFWGKSRVSKDVHPHESGPLMTIPLILLAILSLVGGFLGVPHVLGGVLGHIPNILEGWYSSVIRPIPGLQPADATLEVVLMATSVTLAAISATVAYVFYIKKTEIPARFTEKYKWTADFVVNKFYVDELYFSKLINPLVDLSKSIWLYIDVNFIDKATYVATDLAKGGGAIFRNLQNGNLQQYAMYTAVGLTLVLTFVLMR